VTANSLDSGRLVSAMALTLELMPAHPLIEQLRFTRGEFRRGLHRLGDEDAATRLPPMNSISWNVGHLAWQEQRYFLTFGQGDTPFPDIAEDFAYGCPPSTPPLARVTAAWSEITRLADPWLDELTDDRLQDPVIVNGKPTARTMGNLLLRTIYHYWYHLGENLAIRQQLGHEKLPQFVGNIDDEAPFRPA
jgi:uncharacterized damage-inducible protein DinB